jgi:inorganic pyrophosphatase
MRMSNFNYKPYPIQRAFSEPPEVEVVIEIPLVSFLKRGSTGHIDLISPFPYPFNYGSVPNFLGLEGDLLDMLILSPWLSLGTLSGPKAGC